MHFRKPLTILLLVAILTPIAVMTLLGVGRLLVAMQDSSGALMLDRLALLLAIAWACDLVAIVLMLALERIATASRDEESIGDD